MKLSNTSIQLLDREVFGQLLLSRFRACGVPPLRPDAMGLPVQQLWEAAKEVGDRNGLRSIGAALVVAHLTMELGNGCIEKLAAFQAVASAPDISELEKINGLWRLRCLLLAALEIQPRDASLEAAGALLQSGLAMATPLARQRAGLVARSGAGEASAELAAAARELEAACAALGDPKELQNPGVRAYLMQPLADICVVRPAA